MIFGSRLFTGPPKWRHRRHSSDLTTKGYFLAFLNSITVHFHFFPVFTFGSLFSPHLPPFPVLVPSCQQLTNAAACCCIRSCGSL